MSWVANVLLSVSIAESETTIRSFSDWLRNDAPLREPRAITGVGSLNSLVEGIRWGDGKNPECHVWGGALNHADLDAVVRKFGELPWVSPGSAQLLVMDQEENYFRLWMIRDGRPRQFAPVPEPGDDDAY